MRKFLLFAVATLLSFTTAVSQPRVTNQTNQLPAHKAVNLKAMKAKPQAKSNALQSSRRAGSVITTQPEGTYYNMVYTTDYYGYSLFGLYSGTHDCALSEVVEGTDGNLYLHNIVSELYTDNGYWVKAEKVAGKADTYVIHKQPIYIDYYYGAEYNITKMKITADGDVIPDGNGDITLTWKNQKVVINDMFGAAEAESDGWSGCLNWNASMTPLTATAITELPADVQAIDASMIYYDLLPSESGNKMGTMVQMAFNGNDVYLHVTDEFDSWIKGTINGNTVTFPTKQYIGSSLTYNLHVFLAACDDDYTILDNITFTYDATTKTLTNSDTYLVVNGGLNRIYYLNIYGAPTIAPYVDAAHTPLPVGNFSGSNYIRNYGYGYLDFDAPTFDADGNFLDPNKMYYRVFLGTDYDADKNTCNTIKPFVFTPESYVEFSENTTDIPFTLSGSNFWTNGASLEFVYYFNRACWIGIQSVYRGGGQENVSEISWYGEHNGITGEEYYVPYIENPSVFTSSLSDGEMIIKAGDPVTGKVFSSNGSKSETYDVAIKVVGDDQYHGAKLTGKKVTGISIPFFSVEGISNAKAWLSTSLKLNDDGTFTPDVFNKDFTPAAQGFTTVRFNQGYDIPEDGLYIGYTVTADPDSEPILLSSNSSTGAFLLHSDNIYATGWTDQANVEGNLAMEVIVSGCEAHAAEIEIIDNIYAKVNESSKAKIQVANYGTKGLSNISYDYSLTTDGNEIKNSATLDNLNLKPVFGGFRSLKVDVPAAPAKGVYTFLADVKKANGENNGIDDTEGRCNVTVVDFLPIKRPLLEEYTGTWCGYCPRGYVALEKMAQLYPEDFVALSYHNADPMEVMTSYEFPSVVEGFPAAYLDRDMQIDAYYGNTNVDFGIEQTWKERREEFAPADIDVEAAWSEDGNTINIKTRVSFAAALEHPAISYAVVADGLTGTGDSWAQSNYYSEQAYGTPKYMSQFYNGESHVEGLVFNDVIVAAAERVEGSLPEVVEAGKTYEHQFSFDANAIMNTSGEPVIQDKNKVKIVASLLGWSTVANANKCHVTGATNSGITDRATYQEPIKTVYHDLSGRQVLIPSNGTYLKTVYYKDGTNHTNKVIIK